MQSCSGDLVDDVFGDEGDGVDEIVLPGEDHNGHVDGLQERGNVFGESGVGPGVFGFARTGEAVLYDLFAKFVAERYMREDVIQGGQNGVASVV